MSVQIDLEAAGQVLMSKVPIVLLPGGLSCSVPISSYLTVREGTNGLFSSLFDCNDPVIFKASQWVNYKIFFVFTDDVYVFIMVIGSSIFSIYSTHHT